MATFSKEELEYIATQVKPYLLDLTRADSLELDDVAVVDGYAGVTSLPAYDNSGGLKRVVRVPISMLAKPAEDAAANLSDIANHPTYIGEDFYVYKWNNATKTYEKTDIYVKGEAFKVDVVWASEEEMKADINVYDEGTYGMISTGDVEQIENGRIYVYKNGAWEFFVDMSGKRGETGKTAQFRIGTVEKGDEASVSLVENGEDENGNPIYMINLVLPKGDKGDQGIQGGALTWDEMTDTEKDEVISDISESIGSDIKGALANVEAATKDAIEATEGLNEVVEEQNTKLSELGSKVDEISKSISPTITNLQIDGLLDSVDKIKSTYHNPILSLYDGGVKVSPTLDSSKPYPNIYLTDIGTSDKDETYLVLADIYNIGGGLLQFYLGSGVYSSVTLDKKRLVKTDIVTVPANQRTRFRLQSIEGEKGYYIIYAVMVFKVPDNIPSDEFQRNILNYYNAVGYKQSYGGLMDSEHSNNASVADRLKVKDIELWGDSLTAQNYGKYIEGTTVYTHGFGGKTSTYIRDEFLSNFNKEATQVIWVGRNNYQEIDVVIDDIRDMVSTLTHNNFIIMCPPNGYYGEFGTNGEDGNGEMKGGSNHSKFLELERRLSEEYPSNFLNIRKAVIEGWRMGNVRLLSDFTQPHVGSNVTIEVSDATFLVTYNNNDLDKSGQDFMAKIRIGINGNYDVYKVVEKVDDTHLTVQLEESNRIAVGSTVSNITDSGGNSAVKYLRVMQNADYMCWLYDTTLSTFRNDGIHMTADGLKLVAQIVSRKLASMKLL